MIKTLEEMLDRAKSLGRKRLAVAAADEFEVLKAVEEARKSGIVDGILVGDKRRILKTCNDAEINPENFSIIDIPDSREAADECCRLIRNKEADFIMKGAIKTSAFMKAILDKQNGLAEGGLLSHVAVFEINGFNRLLFITDAAINISPSLWDKVQIIKNAVNMARNIGYNYPKVACLAAVEVVNPDKMPDTVDSAALAVMSLRKQIKNCVIDGPLALDVAISEKAVEIKGITSPVAGKADILLAPEIISANILYKSLTYLAGAKAAAIVTGTIAPVVLTSRADDHQTKFLSIAMGTAGVKSEK